MRLIDADKLIHDIEAYHLSDGKFQHWIELQPTIESPVQPMRKKGRWIYNSPVTMKCDQCEFVIKDWDWNRFNFCPNCCADMRGEQDAVD